MALEDVRAFAVTRWRWLAGVLLALGILASGWCYGRAQYARGRDVARVDVADSVGKVYEERFNAMRMGLDSQVVAFRAAVTLAQNQAAAAETRAAAAEGRARTTLTPQVIAQTPPAVLSLIEELRAANRDQGVALADLRVHLDTAVAREARFASALEIAHQALAQKDTTIVLLRRLKDPPHGFWHVAGEVAKIGSGVLAGASVVSAFKH